MQASLSVKGNLMSSRSVLALCPEAWLWWNCPQVGDTLRACAQNGESSQRRQTDRQTELCPSAVDGTMAGILFGRQTQCLGVSGDCPSPSTSLLGHSLAGARDRFPPQEFSFSAAGRNSSLSGLSTWSQWGPFSEPWKTQLLRRKDGFLLDTRALSASV